MCFCWFSWVFTRFLEGFGAFHTSFLPLCTCFALRIQVLWHRAGASDRLRRLLALAVAQGSSTVVLPAPRWHPGGAFGAALRGRGEVAAGLEEGGALPGERGAVLRQVGRAGWRDMLGIRRRMVGFSIEHGLYTDLFGKHEMLMNKFQRKRKQGGRVGFARAILAARAVPYLFCLSQREYMRGWPDHGRTLWDMGTATGLPHGG